MTTLLFQNHHRSSSSVSRHNVMLVSIVLLISININSSLQVAAFNHHTKSSSKSKDNTKRQMGLTNEFVSLKNKNQNEQDGNNNEDLTSLIEKTTSSPLISSVPFGSGTTNGRGPSSRTEFLQWQRQELAHVRREVVQWDGSEGGTVDNESDRRSFGFPTNGQYGNNEYGESGSGVVNGGVDGGNRGVGGSLENSAGGSGGGRMSKLIQRLPSLRRRLRNDGDSSSGSLNGDDGGDYDNNIMASSSSSLDNATTRRTASKSAAKYEKQRQIEQEEATNPDDPTPIATTLKTLERDMSLLDNLVSSKITLSKTEFSLLFGAIVTSGMGPIAFPGTSVTELLAPAAAAFTASITIGSEYLGRVAVADGKEIAANTIQCAAEAEALLASAERVKAITPLCVGVGATCASFALLTPTIVESLRLSGSVQLMTELYLLCPLVSVLAAAVANLALEETREFAGRAINVGVRRFAKSGNVGRTWMSTSEQIVKGSKLKTDRWWSFAWSVLPAPIIGSIVGGPNLSTKCIVVAALAAAQSAYFLALCEGVVARATDAVALKARSAAVCDTYANQGARNSAILPFTSALSAFCAAATAATVELPFIDTVSTLYGTFGEVVVVSTFPILSSAFAAAAAVSKARCEVDAEAACQAASTLALEYDGMNGSGDDPVLRPFLAVRELISLAVKGGWRSVRKGFINPLNSLWQLSRRAMWRLRRKNDGNRWSSGGEGMA
mmetsp:Transcript_9266/g.18689  ORF Transcript_9266/g.18689 Transcript_9266/m.18689 type:complete len:724 (+) Transcript_9266:376-2547(+)|eukprot:CAMPEP_0113393800 /NCGR_PEP_ID=MMETSP0013_2-20120614/12122_1 /TAXON_ID=2843 ORGANISM="Skeletonema costatum, Strain 1716" /NCGR_SAMPLE_ID=MMETSP0013_2 /ASSEMBLY_ACC=CAM_ASM_000158 /LENGTH=723 /DNA_ID=CAMNT_0000277505 /DNA_START=330 /DNA_END=2501 /DNA_ORIENTATION=+ /assembly_acc=CAM_ASM_000158